MLDEITQELNVNVANLAIPEIYSYVDGSVHGTGGVETIHLHITRMMRMTRK